MAQHGFELPVVAALLDRFLQAAREGERIEREKRRKEGPKQREIEERDLRDKQNTILALRRDWGPSYDTNVGAIRAHVFSLPKSERDAILEERWPDGGLKLNTPEKMKDLAAVAVASHLPSGNDLDREIAEHEQLMRRHRREWNRDQVRQDRYHALLRRRLRKD